MTHYHTAIIGGGLAGASAAITLARRGHRVIVLEAGELPRHRVCGEFLSPECANTLTDLGVMDDVRAAGPRWMDEAAITTPSGTEWAHNLPGAAFGISRHLLDDLLARHARGAGADFRTRHTVKGVRGTLADGFSLDVSHAGKTHTLTAQTVIAAHGKRSTLDRTLNRRFFRHDAPFIGLKMHYKARPVPGRVELHTFDGGYCGLSEVEGGAVNACLLARADRLSAAGGLDGFVRWMGEQNPALGDWLSDAEPLLPRWESIAQVSFAPKPPVEGDLLFTGDAAGLIAPLAGNGMGMALDGGQLVAAHIADYLRGAVDAAGLRAGYASAWKTQFSGRLRLGRALQAMLLRPPVMDAALRVANSIPALGEYAVLHTRDAR